MIELPKVKLWADLETVEDSAMEQIKATSTHPMLFKHVAIMPDVHMGWGCTIGTVLALKDAVIPMSVGADIGCGMCAVKTGLRVHEVAPEFEAIHGGLVNRIPVGFTHRGDDQVEDVHKHVPSEFLKWVKAMGEEYQPGKIVERQIGTLGGGNHFIELQKDKDNIVWIMLHSGSRGIGLKISNHHAEVARNMSIDLVEAPEDLEFLPIDSPEGKLYLEGMWFAQDFAKWNRDVLMSCVLDELEHRFPWINADEVINIHHNYVSEEEHFGEKVWVHRKGATRARKGELGIIPGSMGTKSYIVRGKGNADSFNSCSHGAGRVMSRTAARGKRNRKTGEYKTEGVLNVADFESDMEGVYSCNVDRDHLDEAPRCYKDIDQVIAQQGDLIEVVHELTPIFNMKG